MLIKYKLCPSVQHAAIAIIENGAACERVNMNMNACRAGSPPSRGQARFPCCARDRKDAWRPAAGSNAGSTT